MNLKRIHLSSLPQLYREFQVIVRLSRYSCFGSFLCLYFVLDGFWQLHAAVFSENTLKPNVHYLLHTKQQKDTD